MSKNNCSVSIIGGADGPTSVWVAGQKRKIPLKNRLRNYIYRKRSEQVQKKIIAAPHTMEETAAYCIEKYGAVEMRRDSLVYQEEYESLRESLIIRYKPELLGELSTIERPDINDEASVKAFMERVNERRRKAATVPTEEFPIDFHIYEIELADVGNVKVVMERQWGVFSFSYSGKKGKQKLCKKVARDIQSFYGVTEDDIRDKTERYKRHVAALSM